MSVYVLYLIKYNADQKTAMMEKPAMRDCAAVHKKAIADFGGRPIAQFGSYGEWDMVYIYEMPDEKAVAANLHIADASGLAKASLAIPLMPNEDWVASLEIARTTPTAYGSATDA